MTSREATFADWPEVERLARAFHSRNPVVGYNRSAFQETFDTLLSQPNGCAFVLDDGGGVILAAAMQSPFSREIITQEIMWYCEVKGEGLALVDAYIEWARSIGATHCGMTCLDDRVRKLFDRRGYTLAETNFRVF